MRPSRAPAWIAGALALVLVASRLRLVAVFGSRWTDEDQSLLWFAARDLLSGHLREPYFFGQPYGSWFEALVAAPLLALGAPLRWALPLAGASFGTLPWLLLAAVAGWARRSWPTAVAILAAGVAMAVQGTIVSSMPRGLLPGIVVGVVAVAVVLARKPTPATVAVFGFLLVVSASLNVGAGLVTGPVAVHLVVSERSRWRRLAAPLAGGLAGGAVAHVLAQSFYRRHPAYDVHPSPAFAFSADRLTENLGHLGRYLSAYAPEVARAWWLPVAALVAVAVWLVGTRRDPATAAAAATAVVLSVAVLGTAKAGDGAASLWFPFSRVYLGLPWMVAALAVLPSARPRPRRPVPTALVAAVAALALVSGGVREVRLHARTDALVAAAAGVPPVVPVDTLDLARRCELRRRLAAEHHVDVVVDRYDRTATYGCGAVLAGAVTTLFPEYERRTWVLEAADRRRVSRLLVSGLDGCPPAPTGCEEADAAERLFLISGPPRTVTAWARDLGLVVRRT